MKRVLACFALAIAALTLVGGVTAKPKKPKKPKPHAKIFDRGCWKGSGSFDYTSEENGATVEFHKGTLTFTLQISKAGTATGFMDVKAHGSADMPSVNATGEVDITGSFDLGGKGAKVVADGSYHIAGSVISSGYAVPVAWDVDASGPFTIKKATAKVVTGSWGDVTDWTAKHVKAACV